MAERNIECDYTNYDYSQNSTRKVIINDQYILTNTTNEEIVLETVYGFVGNYGTALSMVPKMTINGETINTKLIVGRSPLRYKAQYKEKGLENANDLFTLHNRECFELLLADGIYQKEALEAAKKNVL